MNTLPIDNPSSPDRKEQAPDMLILGCPSCGHLLRLAYQHLWVEGNCVRCHTAIMGVEFSPGKFGAVYVNQPKIETPLPVAEPVSWEKSQSIESPVGLQNVESNASDTGVPPGFTMPVNPPDFGPLPQSVNPGCPNGKNSSTSEVQSSFETGVSKPQEFETLPPVNGFMGPALVKAEPEEPNQGESAILPVTIEPMATSTSFLSPAPVNTATLNAAVPEPEDKETEASQIFLQDTTFGLSPSPEQLPPIPQIVPDQTLPQENATLSGGMSGDSAQPSAFVPREDSESHVVVDEVPKVVLQYDPFGPPVEAARTSATQNSQPAISPPGLDVQIPKQLDVLSPAATPLEGGADFHIPDRFVTASATPAPQATSPKPEPVTFPSINLPKVAPPKDHLSTSNILILLFTCSVIIGFGSYVLTPYEKKVQIKSQLVDWLEPGSVVIEQLPFGLGKKVLE